MGRLSQYNIDVEDVMSYDDWKTDPGPMESAEDAPMTDLLGIIGHDCATPELGFCVQPHHGDKPNQKYYTDWEKETAERLLIEKGYKIRGWFTGDGDSFGPLTRVVRVIAPNGEREELWYG